MPRALRPLLALGAALLAAPAPAPAQQRVPRALGFQLGYSRASFVGLPAPGPGEVALEGRQSAFVGAWYRLRLAPWVAVQPELNFVIKGGQTPFTTAADTVARAALELGYLELPVLVRLAPPRRARGLRPVLFGGAGVGLRAGCSLRLESSTSVSAVECADAGLPVRRAEFTWVAGGGVTLYRSGFALGLEGRIAQGMRGLTAGSPVKNRIIAVLLVASL